MVPPELVIPFDQHYAEPVRSLKNNTTKTQLNISLSIVFKKPLRSSYIFHGYSYWY